jgi:hypothetical protein
MANKLPQKTFPAGSGPNDFQCFGPAATTDGQFDSVKICDMGCFTQDGKDSNKYYHAAVVQNKNTKKWYAYFEWGRTGAKSPSFQFVECGSEAEACMEFADQLHSKNDKRGEWTTIAGIRTLQAKKGKDCYLVRPMATRSTGLPDARSIKTNEGAKPKKAASGNGKAEDKTKTKSKGKTAKKSAPSADKHTLSLMRDLSVATVAYTRGSMADASLPTQKSIDEARDILTEAQKRLLKVGDDVDDQVKDKELKQLTGLMYMRIPKIKAVGAAAHTWILSKENILAWTHDLDAFESALYAADLPEEEDFDPLKDMRLTMEWMPADSKEGKFLCEWWPKATMNRHAHIGAMKIKNLWRVERHDDKDKLPPVQDTILKEKPKIGERPLCQPKERADLTSAEQKRYKDTNTALLFHGTRSVNVSGILREALRMPKQLVGVVITGAMFGPGLYFADDWKKSAGYTSLSGSVWSGGGGSVKGRDAFMFAADVVLGNPHVAKGPSGFTAPPKGHHSVFGKGGVSQVQNNEFIVFDAKQNQLRYLIEFNTGK